MDNTLSSEGTERSGSLAAEPEPAILMEVISRETREGCRARQGKKLSTEVVQLKIKPPPDPTCSSRT